MVEYSINDWDIFKFPILSLKDLDLKQIIYTIETKIKNQDTFSDRELIELAITPILPTNRKDIINQFFETADLISRISFPNEDIKNSVCGLVMMLTNIYFDELEEVRKKIQGVYMGKIDCVVEFGQERYEEGIIDKSEGIARRLIDDGGFSDEKISELVVLPLERIVELRNSL